MDEQCIRIKFKAFAHKVLDLSSQKIVDAVRETGVSVKGPIPLPRRIKKFTVLRGPHIDKKSREQFEMVVHSRIVDIINPTLQTVNALMKLDLPAGVSVEVKL